METTFKQQFLAEFLGEMSLAIYASAFLFAVIGVIISLRIAAEKRDRLSPNTPFKFNVWFMLRDNFIRGVSGLLMGFIVFRFFPYTLGENMYLVWAFLLGLGSDQLIQVFEKWQDKARISLNKTKI